MSSPSNCFKSMEPNFIQSYTTLFLQLFQCMSQNPWHTVDINGGVSPNFALEYSMEASLIRTFLFAMFLFNLMEQNFSLESKHLRQYRSRLGLRVGHLVGTTSSIGICSTSLPCCASSLPPPWQMHDIPPTDPATPCRLKFERDSERVK